jgi:hypothetical protein
MVVKVIRLRRVVAGNWLAVPGAELADHFMEYSIEQDSI